MNRPLVRYILPVFLGSACVMLSRKIRPGKKDLPNILLFAVDSLGWQDTSVPFSCCDGLPEAMPLNAFYNTPGMELLAQHGVRMTHAYGACDERSGVVSLMSGLDPARFTGLSPDTEIVLQNMCSPGEKTDAVRMADLAHLMKKGGYRTIVSGSTEEEKQHGFDVRRSTEDESGLHEEIGRAVHEGIPFFACVRRNVHSMMGSSVRHEGSFPELGENIKVEGDALLRYASSVEAMDASLGGLLQCLEDLGAAGRTLVLFVPLSGGDSPIQKSLAGNVSWVEEVGAVAPLRGRKYSRYEGGGRVPMIVSWAELDPQEPCQQALPIVPDSVQEAIVSVQDILPTLAAVAGVKVHERVDGYNIADYLSGASEGERPQWIVRHFPFSHPYGRFYTSLRIREWKVIYNYYDDYAETGNPAWQLFNLKIDPSESRNLADDPSCTKLLSVMSGKLAAYLESIHAPHPFLTDPESPRVNGRRTVTGTAVIRFPGDTGAGVQAG